MTALKPVESRKVRGVASTRYPIGTICSHPECDRTDVTAHHIFPRSMIGNSSWWVEIDAPEIHRHDNISKKAVPHVVPLCGHGTDGHHGDVEEHRAWIKYEDGQFVWYERDGEEWNDLGVLDPQPLVPAPKKRRRKNLKGDERKEHPKVSLHFPTVDDKLAFLDALDQLNERWSGDEKRSKGFLALLSAQYTLLNAGPEDFV